MSQDTMLKLALNIYNCPKVFALLLGSGISKNAGIPTGWDIVLDLINKVAATNKKEPIPSPEEWYRNKYKEEPDYSNLLDKLTKTPAERMSLLRPYFEPNSEEMEQGIKLPTKAHKAIAVLVKNGFIRIIITTNFDRLLEQALQEEGIIPDVISSIDNLTGALPYIHSKCTVIKLHGDYLDTRIRNTFDELSNYPEELNKLLDRIFDEHGLIICGWSGTWDIALRNAILRTQSRRFGYYWLNTGSITEEAERIINVRRAEKVFIKDADSFFDELLQKITSLQEVMISAPLDAKLVEATVKRYLSDSKFNIMLHDMVTEETERVYERLQKFDFPTNTSKELFSKRLQHHEQLSLKLIKMLIATSYYDKGENSYLLVRSLERLSNQLIQSGGSWLIELQKYPALLVYYASGIAAIAGNKINSLAYILLKPRMRTYRTAEKSTLFLEVNPESVLEGCKHLTPRPNGRDSTPGNNHIFEFLQPLFKQYILGDDRYAEIFDIFEYFLTLAYMDLTDDDWAPTGRFTWSRARAWNNSPCMELVKEAFVLKEQWPYLQAGFFNGSFERFRSVSEKNKDFIGKVLRSRLIL